MFQSTKTGYNRMIFKGPVVRVDIGAKGGSLERCHMSFNPDNSNNDSSLSFFNIFHQIEIELYI